MNLNKQQKRLWEKSLWEEEAKKDSRSKAFYIPKYLRDIGETGIEELDRTIDQIRKIANKIDDIYTRKESTNV